MFIELKASKQLFKKTKKKANPNKKEYTIRAGHKIVERGHTGK